MKVKDLKSKDFKKIIKILAILFLLIFLFKGVIFLVILITLSFSLSFIINNFPIRNIGIELVTFIGVLSAVKYGPWIGALITFILIAYHLIASGFLGIYILWVIPAYCIASFLAGILNLDLVQMGVYATLGININNLIFTILTSPSNLPRFLPYAITNILFNFLLFSLFGKIIYLII